MKINTAFYKPLLAVLLLTILFSCKKEAIKVTPASTAILPILTTTVVSSLTSTTAISGGNITSDGGAEVTARGVCWSTSTTPTITNNKTTNDTGVGSFTSSLFGLALNTTYYLRAYATNSIGTAYGNEIILKTYTGTVTDIDGNVYHTVTNGTKVWMVENLKVTHYRNGDPIPNVTDGTPWSTLTTGAYSWYNNDEATYKTSYGALYNWYSVNDSRKIAPYSWHVSSDAEWTTLTTYLGGTKVAVAKLKEAGTAHWISPNTGATNESGFTALPGGMRFNNGPFINGDGVAWWTSTQCSALNATAFVWSIGSYMNSLCEFKNYGHSVRCVKD